MITAELHSGITFSNVPDKEMDAIKRDLTFDNPEYANVKKYSRYQYTTVYPYVMYYDEVADGVITVPIGYQPRFQCTVTKDHRVTRPVKYPPFVLDLREDQQTAADAYLYRKGDTAFAVKLPTGKGKSVLGVYLAATLGQKTLIVVHKDDLVKGWQADIKLAFDGLVKPGLIKAQSRAIGEQITIATIQTLNRLSPRELAKLYDRFGLVIQDEMHHCPATSFALVADFTARYRLGLTATPERKDGLGFVMQLYFGEFCYEHEYSVDDEDILPVKVIYKSCERFYLPTCRKIIKNGEEKYVLTDLDLPKGAELPPNHYRINEIEHRKRPRVDYHKIDDLAVNENMEQLLQDVYEEYRKGHSCLVFFSKKEQCRDFGKLINRTYNRNDPKVWFGYFYGDNTEDQNDMTKMTAREQRQFITITIYAKATEGTDCPQWEVEFLASSLNDEKNTEQAAGRIRRVQEAPKLGTALLYDYRFPNIYAIASHGMTRDRRYRKLKFILPKKTKTFGRGYKD